MSCDMHIFSLNMSQLTIYQMPLPKVATRQPQLTSMEKAVREDVAGVNVGVVVGVVGVVAGGFPLAILVTKSA